MWWYCLSEAGAEEPPPVEIVAVAFSPSGDQVAIETRWQMEGSGFPVGRIEVRDTATGASVREWTETLREDRANLGLAGASAAVRTAATELSASGIDLTRPTQPLPCSAGQPARCGISQGGCRDSSVTIQISGTPTTDKQVQCYGQGSPALLKVEVNGTIWLAETTPVDGCQHDFALQAFYQQGDRGLVVVSYQMPGHEGPVERSRTVTGTVSGRR